MKQYLYMLLLCCTSYACAEEQATVTLKYGATVSFTTENSSGPYVHWEGPCIYKNRLWVYAVLTNPPRKILTSGVFTLEGESILLDVSGIANPWIKSEDFNKGDCKLTKFKSNGKDSYYILKVAFLKGGAEDYIVTWVIYKNKSVRESVENVGDQYPEWIESATTQED